MRFDQRALLEALPEVLEAALADGEDVTVLACHACQHLSDQVAPPPFLAPFPNASRQGKLPSPSSQLDFHQRPLR